MFSQEERRIIESTFKNIESKGITEYLEKSGYFSAPASKSHHGNHEGGLFEHSYRVAQILSRLTQQMGLKWERPESPRIIGLLHDLCKVDSYKIENGKIEYNDAPCLTGHGDKSCILALQYIDLTDEELMCIRYHMGAFIEADKESYSRAVSKYPNVLWTHAADMLASQVDGI